MIATARFARRVKNDEKDTGRAAKWVFTHYLRPVEDDHDDEKKDHEVDDRED